MLVRNKDEQEIVSRERKDRRDFEQLSALATRMGLHRYWQFVIIMFLLYFISDSAYLMLVALPLVISL